MYWSHFTVKQLLNSTARSVGIQNGSLTHTERYQRDSNNSLQSAWQWTAAADRTKSNRKDCVHFLTTQVTVACQEQLQRECLMMSLAKQISADLYGLAVVLESYTKV